ncbi:hypothetical protein DFH27DRAFT_187581 [Peziza echinospora]|nr:hypothetical protein DFH27DRAFT_187581 [Peziza echinospora]
MPTTTTSSSSSVASSISPPPPLLSPTTPTNSSMTSSSSTTTHCTTTLLSPSDASLRADINRRLLESGDLERLTTHLGHLLRESGWREQTLNSCTRALRDQDMHIANYSSLYSAVEQDAVAAVDAAIKIDVVRRIREVLESMVDL